MRLVVPPTLTELLENETYAAWFKRDPRMPGSVRRDAPWQIIARRTPGAPGATWAVRRMPSYADAYRRARRMLGDPEWEDVAVCSRAVMFRPPRGFEWSSRFHWCARCRRPSLFQPTRLHPVTASQVSAALRSAIMLVPEKQERCYYCGIRRVALPRYG